MSPYEPFFEIVDSGDVLTRAGRRDYDPAPTTDLHDTRRLYVTGTLQELRNKLAKGPLGRDWQGLEVLRTVDEYLVQIEEFMESTAPEGT